MSEFVAMGDNVKLFLDSLKLSVNLTSINFQMVRSLEEATTFPNEYRRFLPGLKDVQFSGTGQADFADDANNEQLYARLSTEGHLVSIDVNGVSYFYQASIERFDPIKGEPGAISTFDFSLKKYANVKVVRGPVLNNSEVAPTFPFTGAVIELGTAPAGARLYATHHVLAGSGGTLTVLVESDSAVGFATPTTAITFTGATGVTSEIKSIVASADTHYRVTATITGGTLWNFFVAVGYAVP